MLSFFLIFPKSLDLITYCLDAITYLAKKKNSKMCFELFLYKLPVIKEIVAALKIPYDVTILLQNVSFTLSDFYGCWLTTFRRLERLAAAPNQITEFAQTLLNKIQTRQSCLLNNEAMICAVYLDKRYEFKLSADERQIARNALEKLFERVKTAKRELSPPDSDAKNDITEDSFEEACVAAGLSRTFPSDSQRSMSNDVSKYFVDLTESYEAIDRQHNKSDILAFWDEYKSLHPEIYELASIMFSIPPTLCTVERPFSILGYVYDCRRTRLSPSILENLQMINLNRELADPINERDLQNL